MWRLRLLTRLPVTAALTALIAAVFACEAWLGGVSDFAVLVRMGAVSTPRIAGAHEYWRLITSIFLHYGWLHFVLNGFALVQLVALTELLYGSARAIWFFAVCGLIGAQASVLGSWQLVGVGASGALYGLVGLLFGVALFGEASWRMRLVELRRPLSTSVALMIGLVAAGWLFPLLPVANGAHVGGFVCGLLLAGAFPDPSLPPRASDRLLAGGAVALALWSGGQAYTEGPRALAELPDTIQERIDTVDGELSRAGLALGLLDMSLAAELPDADARFARAIESLSPFALQALMQSLYDVPGREGATLRVAVRWAELAPDDPDALNSAAWLLLTGPDPATRDAARAEPMARRALEVIGSDEALVVTRAMVLDTHAEALLQLGRIDEALAQQRTAVTLGDAHGAPLLDEMKERLARIEALAAGG